MSDTANVARGAYRQHFKGNPATADSWTGGTKSLHGPSGKLIARSLVGELEELRGSEACVFLGELPIDRETLLRLFHWVTLPNEAAPWPMQIGRGPVGGHHVSVSPWSGKEGLDTVDYVHLADTGPHPSGVTLQHAMLHSPTGEVELLPHDDRDLQEALSDLNSLNEEAKEDDLPEPDAEAVANARTMLPRLYAILPVRYRVSPTERRGVAIDAPMKWGASVAVECAPDDTVYCFATVDGNSRRAKFYQMDGLPDVFIEKALRDLAAS